MEDMMGSHVLDHPEEEGCTEKDTVSWWTQGPVDILASHSDCDDR